MAQEKKEKFIIKALLERYIERHLQIKLQVHSNLQIYVVPPTSTKYIESGLKINVTYFPMRSSSLSTFGAFGWSFFVAFEALAGGAFSSLKEPLTCFNRPFSKALAIAFFNMNFFQVGFFNR